MGELLIVVITLCARYLLTQLFAELVGKKLVRESLKFIRLTYPYSHYYLQHKGSAAKCPICPTP